MRHRCFSADVNYLFVNLRSFILFLVLRWKTNKDHIIVTADNGVAPVVLDRSEYIKKIKELLEDTITYRPLNMDPTNNQKNKLINILRRIKTESGMEDTT